VNEYLRRHGLIVAAVVMGALIVSFLLTRSPISLFRTPLPSYGQIPPFTLTERSGKAIAASDLQGKIWVANFIYTTCPGPCRDLTRAMAQLQKQIPAGIDCRFVSFTVDPVADTPSALKTYAESHNADSSRWLFVTGGKDALYDLFENGFHIVAARNDEASQSTDGKFIHTTKLILIDWKGTIRGYYDGLLPESRAKLMSDLSHLNREKG
jgi:protein SCO1/2